MVEVNSANVVVSGQADLWLLHCTDDLIVWSDMLNGAFGLGHRDIQPIIQRRIESIGYVMSYTDDHFVIERRQYEAIETEAIPVIQE